MGNSKKKNQPAPVPVDKEVKKSTGKKELIVFTKVPTEELERRRVPVYPYIM